MAVGARVFYSHSNAAMGRQTSGLNIDGNFAKKTK